MSVRFGDLSYPEVGALRETTTVLLLPLGAVEPHGPHAPLATDTLISVGLCERAAGSFSGGDEHDPRVLVLPPLAYGVTRYGRAFPGAVSVSERTLRTLVLEICASLAEQGLDRIVLVNNHFEPEQVRTLREAAQSLGPRVRLFDPTRRENAQRLTEEFRFGSCHAGRYETSLILADAPALVDHARMEVLESRMIDMPAAIAAGRTDFVAMGMDEAYCGAPADASAEEGEETFRVLSDMLVELVREVAAA